MTLDEYQKLASKTDLFTFDEGFKASEPAFIAKILGLSGEAGEVSEKFKKIIRDRQGVINEEDRAEITKELGDVLWYVAMISKYLGISFEEVAKLNIDKLSSRQTRGTQRGSGDNR